MKDIIDPEKKRQESEIPEDETIIELTDVVAGKAESEDETIIELTDMAEDAAEAEHKIIELTDIANEPLPESTQPVERIDEDEEGETLEPVEASLAVSSDRVDAAIERVVREMLSEKIDSILFQVIEKEVSKEIERLKGLLMGEPANKE